MSDFLLASDLPPLVPLHAPFPSPLGQTRAGYLQGLANGTLDLLVSTLRTHGILAMANGLQDGIIGYPDDGTLPFDAYVFSDLHKTMLVFVHRLLPFVRQSNVDHLFMLIDQLAGLEVDMNGSLGLLSDAKEFFDGLRVPSKTLALGPVEGCIKEIRTNFAMRSSELSSQIMEIHDHLVATAHKYVKNEVERAIDKASSRFLSVRQTEELTEGEDGEIADGPTTTIIVKTPDRATHSSRSREAAIDKRNRKRHKRERVNVENGKDEMPPLSPVPFHLDGGAIVVE
jgi:hypothetical protein